MYMFNKVGGVFLNFFWMWFYILYLIYWSYFYEKIRILLELIRFILNYACVGDKGIIVFLMIGVFIELKLVLIIYKEKILVFFLFLVRWMLLVFLGIWVYLVEF